MCRFSSESIERHRLESIVWARRIAGRGASVTLLHDFGADGWTMGRFENPIIAVRAAHREAGRCGCGEPLDTRPDGTTVATCCVCRDRQRRQSTRRYLAARSSGGCTWPGCVTAAAPGRRRCEAHLQRDRAANNARRAAGRLAAVDRRAGVCLECSAEAVDGGTRCERHVKLHAGRCARLRLARRRRAEAADRAQEIEDVRMQTLHELARTGHLHEKRAVD